MSTTTPSCFLSNLFRFSRMILWNGNFSFPCGTTLSPFPVNFQRITTQQQRHPFCLIRSSTPTLTVLLRTKKRIPKPAWHPHPASETCASHCRTESVLSQPYQKHQQSPERVVILYSAKLLFSYFPARSRRTFPYVRKIYLPVFPGTFPAYALAVYHVPAVIPRKASAGNHKSLHHRDSTAERLSKCKLFYPDI